MQVYRNRTVLSWCLACSAFATFITGAFAKPNVVIIYTDDQGYGDASCLNPEAKFKTPNLDRLAKEGIAFTNAHSADTVCTPSRYGLLTGRYCWRTRLKRSVMVAEGRCLIADDRTTIATMLSKNGYATAMVGKWHLGMDFPGDKGNRDWSQPVKDMPLDKGFDYFFGVPASLNYGVLAWFEGRHAKAPPTVFTAKKPNKRHVDYRIKPPYQATAEETQKVLRKAGMEVAEDFIDNQCLTRFTDKAIDWMRKHTTEKPDQPFFLYLPLTSPHYPVCPLKEFWGQGECGGYGEFMIETDHHIGRLLDFLKEQGLEEDTLVIVCSDNGPETSWKKRINDFGHHSNANFRGGKRDIYEGGHRVPLIMRWPAGVKQPGRKCDDLVGQVDIFSTIAEIVEAEVGDSTAEDSISFAGVLESTTNHARPALINHGIKGRFAITDQNWKLVLPHGKTKHELYNLQRDPGESKNLIADHPDIAGRLTKQLTDIVIRGRTSEGSPQPNDTGYWKDLTWMDEATYGVREKVEAN